MKIKVFFLILIFLGAFGINKSIADTTGHGMYIYQIADVKDQTINIQLNMSNDAHFDLAVVNTRYAEAVAQAIKYPHMKSPHLLAITTNSGTTKNISYASAVDVLYVVIFDRNVVFADATEGTYTVTANTVTENVPLTQTTFTSIADSTFKYLQGTELTENGDGKLNSEEYKVYSKDITAGENLVSYLSQTSGEVGVFLIVGNKPSAAKISQTITSIRNYIVNTSQTVPNVDMFDIPYDNTAYITYYAAKDTTVNVVVFSLDYVKNKDVSIIYKLWSNLPIGSQNTGKWYSVWFINWMHSTNYDKPPNATIVLIFISLATSLFSAGVTRLLVDLDELNMYQEKINKHNKLKTKAKNTADKKLWAKVQSHESLIQDFQKKMVFKKMLPQLFITLPFFIIFPALRGALGDPTLNYTPDRGGIIAVLPFYIPSWFPIFGKWVSLFAQNTNLSAMGFGFWYFLSAMMSSTILQKVFGINIQGTKQQNPFSQN